MTLPKETLATGAPDTCRDCGVELIPKVCESAAGFYIGTWCDCGPYTRESGYYPSAEAAQEALDLDGYWRL